MNTSKESTHKALRMTLAINTILNQSEQMATKEIDQTRMRTYPTTAGQTTQTKMELKKQ